MSERRGEVAVDRSKQAWGWDKLMKTKGVTLTRGKLSAKADANEIIFFKNRATPRKRNVLTVKETFKEPDNILRIFENRYIYFSIASSRRLKMDTGKLYKIGADAKRTKMYLVPTDKPTRESFAVSFTNYSWRIYCSSVFKHFSVNDRIKQFELLDNGIIIITL